MPQRFGLHHAGRDHAQAAANHTLDRWHLLQPFLDALLDGTQTAAGEAAALYGKSSLRPFDIDLCDPS